MIDGKWLFNQSLMQNFVVNFHVLGRLHYYRIVSLQRRTLQFGTAVLLGELGWLGVMAGP